MAFSLNKLPLNMVLLFSRASVQTSKVKLIHEFQNSDDLWLTWLNFIPWLHADGSDCKFLTNVLFENHRTWFALSFLRFYYCRAVGRGYDPLIPIDAARI